jgi:glycosyltransferase involved in cell wall biosynthesis
MRIAHFVQRYPPALGGAEVWFARLSRALAAAGDRVTVFTTTALDLDAFWSPRGRCLPAGTSIEDGVEVRRYPLWRCPGRRWLLKPLSLLPHRLWQCLTLPCNPIAPRMWRDAGRRDTSFDLVHVTALPYGWPMACGLRMARRLGVPLVMTPFLHLGDLGDPSNRTRRAYTAPHFRYLLRAADRIFVQTAVEQSALQDLGISEERLHRLGMGVDAGECAGGDRWQAREAWGATPDEVVIGHLANLSEEKGTVDLLRAAAMAWQRSARFRVVLAGSEMPNFQRFWRDYPLAERVCRLGVLSAEEKRDFFAGIDGFALPSRSDSFGLVLLEAWANSVPSIVYRAGGPGEVVRHEVDGLQVRCGDLEGLAAALTRLAADEPLRRRLGEAGAARTRREFGWEDRLSAVRTVYRDLCQVEGVTSTPSARRLAACAAPSDQN